MFINGRVIDSQNISLGPGESTKVSFSHTDNELGNYEVKIEDYQDEYKVVIPKMIIIAVICTLIILLITGIYIFRRWFSEK